MRTSEQIQAEIEEKFGFFPPFFSPALHNSQVLENLWQQTLIAYIHNPLSAVFKEKLSAYLSRFCTVPYCMICHSCTLRPLGMKAEEVLQLLETPPPNVEEIESHLQILATYAELNVLPEANSPLEESLLICAIFIFLEGEAAETYRTQLRQILGASSYQHLVAFVAYVKTCHVWAEANPEVSYEADKRVLDNLSSLVTEEPRLIEFFRNYAEKVKQERQTRAERQAILAERQRNLEVLRESEERYRKLVELLPDTLFVQCEGKFVFANSAGVKLLGADNVEQLIGQPVFNFIHSESQEIAQERIQKLKTGKSAPFIEEKFVRLDGSVVDVEVAAFPFVYSGNLAAQVVARDISLRKQAEKERAELLAREQAARTEAESANRSKDEFLAIVSHELRSPLNAMLGWARLLRTRKFDAVTMERALETIERNGQAQLQLLEDLLDISRIIRGKIYLNVCTVDILSVITAAIETVQLAADTKSIELLSVVEASSSILVRGDFARLQQVIWNLLSNAIKFTPNGGQIVVRSQLIDSIVRISVSDTGIGISADFLPFVFDRFRQADSTTSRKEGGLGLGLAIVRQLVELHHGTVYVTSAGEGQGATFTVELPLSNHQVTNQQDVVSSFTTARNHLTGLRILIVDDEADIRDYVTTVLEEYGAQVQETASVDAALIAIEKSPPDILVSDIGMPQQDGYSLIQKIRTLTPERGRNIPAIALTAYARDEDRQRALAAGFQLYATKPIEPVKLVVAIAKLVGRST
ncbi:ATP-binding protein [Gloeocapsopsis sp. IPPAS B-1203]|uniref:hybrid sensor histidine kinase/response regulator n=1 Tax=Gloeocapsopsis sp. IPPAS B-1203 TaxID=2049454 RepID=UPI000C19C357|nr:ATP-binding protein [Gloeocapsopsis sp. IPPAS B-1203]PIG91131.1 hybrid sensor histidine kinase/response regulator [Gloeocapsopsis sp. IPPAS B-1203]